MSATINLDVQPITQYIDIANTNFDTIIDMADKLTNCVEDLKLDITKQLTSVISQFTAANLEYGKLQKDIADNKFEETNFKKVSLISQTDKYNRQLQIKIEEYEKKIKFLESQTMKLTCDLEALGAENKEYIDKIAELESQLEIAADKLVISNLSPVTTTPSPVTTTPTPVTTTPTPVATTPTPVTTISASVSSVHQCFARIGKEKYNVEKQTPGFMSEYPSGTYISKTNRVFGRPCSIIVNDNAAFCGDHMNGFEDIRIEPSAEEGVEKKKKKKVIATNDSNVATSSDATATPSDAKTAPSDATATPSDATNQSLDITNTIVSTCTTTETPFITTETPFITIETPSVTVETTSATVETTSATVEPVPITDDTGAKKRTRTKKTDTGETKTKKKTASNSVATASNSDTVDIPSTATTAVTAESSAATPKVTPVLQTATSNKIEKPTWADIDFYDSDGGTSYYMDKRNGNLFEYQDNDVGAFIGNVSTHKK